MTGGAPYPYTASTEVLVAGEEAWVEAGPLPSPRYGLRVANCDWWRAGHVTTVLTSDWSSHDSADWSRGEINVTPDIIKHFWVPDIVIHDLVRYYLK